MTTHGTLTERSSTDSLITPIGKGREGNRKGREGNPLLTLANVDTREDSLVSVGRPIDAGLRDAGEKRCIIWLGVAS
jgi:hypothetical protein